MAIFGHASGTFRGKRGQVPESRITMPTAWRATVLEGKIKAWQVYADWSEGMKVIQRETQNGYQFSGAVTRCTPALIEMTQVGPSHRPGFAQRALRQLCGSIEKIDTTKQISNYVGCRQFGRMAVMKAKFKLFVGNLLLTVCLSGGFGLTSPWAGTEILLYPVARAFGSPSESELARCRVSFKQLQAGLEKSRVLVMPVLFAGAGRCQWRRDLAAAEMCELATRTSAKIEVSSVEPKVAAPPRFHNQLRYLSKRSKVYRDWIKATHPSGDYVLVTEIFGGGGEVGAIQIYLFDSSGQVAYCRLLNSHQFGTNLPLAGEGAVKLIVNTFIDNLKWDANKLFPPYGVG